MTGLAGISDHSEMPVWPWWMWLLALALIGLAYGWAKSEARARRYSAALGRFAGEAHVLRAETVVRGVDQRRRGLNCCAQTNELTALRLQEAIREGRP